MTPRHWGLGATLLAFAVVAVVVLPPRPFPEEYNFAASVLGFSYRFWYGGHVEGTANIQRIRDRYAESVAARPHGAADVRASGGPLALRSAREPVTVVRDADVPIDIAREWLRDAEMELAAYPRATSAGVPVIIGLHTANIFPGSRPHPYYSAARFLYAEGRDTACIADVALLRTESPKLPMSYRHLSPRGMGDDRRIGRCALYARYGAPGARVRTWYGFPARWQWTSDGDLRAELVWRSPLRSQIERIPQWGFGDWPISLACLNSGVGCEEIFRMRQRRDDEQRFYRRDAALLVADLLKSRGPDRFVRFWRSALPVDSALEDAYGVPGGALGREAWLRRVIPPPPAGPHRGAAATTVAWLAGLLGIATLLSRRGAMGV